MSSTEVPGANEWTFTDPALEKLYRSHSSNQKRTGLQCFLLGAILFDIYTLIVPLGQHLVAYIVSGCCLVLAIVALVWCRIGFTAPRCRPVWQLAPHFAWHLFNAQLLLHLFVRSYLGSDDVTARDSLGWALLLVYLVYVTLPLRLRYCIMLSLGTCASYIVALVGLSKSDKNLIEQHLANSILLLAANLFGLMSYFLEDAQQRRAFLETRQSLQVKLVIEEQSAEQERLLLSVLPEHVAVKMRQDLGSTDSQFKKIYMSRHENVSILYADIVGFTAISSTYSAQDLVKILNELFARFDRLAEKYNQLRIKILGDCYYCISGAPVERPDHAVLCVHMGLSMVKAIKYVQQTTNSPVDMRVGIHTGAVLAGVLGQRQWQFDVYSKDVELANKMESSGMAGRVHISHQTLSFLDGEFEVEPAHGEKREEALRMAGIKTYFIVKVLKPYSTPVPEIRNGAAAAETEETILAEGLFDTKEESKCNSPIAEESQAREDSDDFKNRLRTELTSRDGHRELQKRTSRFTLRFRSSSTERQYGRHREPLSAIPLLSLPLAAAAALASQWIAVPILDSDPMGIESDSTAMRLESAISIAVTVVLAVVTLGAAAETAPKVFPRCIVLCSRALNDSMYVRRIIAILGIILLAIANTINMSTCNPDSNLQQSLTPNCTNRQLAAGTGDSDFLPATNPLVTPQTSCNHPSYFSCSAALCLVTAAILPQLSHLTKALLMTLVTAVHCSLNLLILSNRLDCEDFNSNRDWNSFTPGKLTLSYMLIAVTIALSYLARHMERVSRVSFLWKTSVTEQREKASDMRQRNEALVYNVLPPHVAAHFMGQRKRQHDELYSQSYAEVGVLFASMPNFSDFYSEETVNNQGLECLRFLNEVISDFDALLELPQFKDIIKIKTIGSTYMAASGLKPTDIVQSPNAPITSRWSHLALLVDFALELKRALQCINEQSFNHFVLKMGVNHGPITAGVIGARKPHYDIWGNTVNVASRMESTGKAGAIQVTEETCDILQHFGYTFEQRGLVAVKGKGQLMTYYLQGKTNKPPASPLVGLTTMETLKEEDELMQGDSDSSPIAGFNATSPGSVRLCPSNSSNQIKITGGQNSSSSQRMDSEDVFSNVNKDADNSSMKNGNEVATDDVNAALMTSSVLTGDAESDALLPKDK